MSRVGKELLSGSPRVKDAIQELKAILALDPRSAQAHMLLGIAYRMVGSPDFMGEAVAEFRQALELEPRFVPARFYLARVYLDLGRTERAREELERALVDQPNHPQFLGLLGETERQLKNPRRAVELTRQALQADASSAETRYYLGLALFDAGERDEAIKTLEQVLASGAAQVDLHASLGAAYVDAGREDEAVTVLLRGAKLDPSRPDLHVQLSRAYRRKGLLLKAEQQLKLASPADIGALASGYQQHQIEFDVTLEQGLLAMARKRPGEAVVAFRKALSMDPGHGPATRHLAEAYLAQGSYALAAEQARRAEELGAPLPDDKRALLEKLQGKGTGTGK